MRKGLGISWHHGGKPTIRMYHLKRELKVIRCFQPKLVNLRMGFCWKFWGFGNKYRLSDTGKRKKRKKKKKGRAFRWTLHHQSVGVAGGSRHSGRAPTVGVAAPKRIPWAPKTFFGAKNPLLWVFRWNNLGWLFFLLWHYSKMFWMLSVELNRRDKIPKFLMLFAMNSWKIGQCESVISPSQIHVPAHRRLKKVTPAQAPR